MHEASICLSLMKKVQETTHHYPGALVRHIHLKIGPLSGIDPHLLEQAFRISKKEPALEGAILNIECTAAKVRCLDCQEVSEVPSNHLCCRPCGSTHTQLLSGSELYIDNIDLSIPEETFEGATHV